MKWICAFLLIFTVSLMAKADDPDLDIPLDILQSYHGPYDLHPYYEVLTGKISAEQQRDLMALVNNPRRQHTYWILPLFFKTFSSQDTQWVQLMVDLIHLQLLSKSPTARKVCQQVTNGEPLLLQQIFGLSQKTSHSLRSFCQAETGWRYDGGHFPTREYLFALSERDAVLDSWTSLQGVTTLIINPKTITLEHLLRMFIHEMAIYLDQKEYFGTHGRLTYSGQSVIYTGSHQCALASAIRAPLIKFSFSAIRAEQLEDQILKELGFAVSPDKASSCLERAIDSVVSLVPAMSSFMLQFIVNQEFGDATCVSGQDIVSQLELLNTETLQDHDGRTKSFCQFLTEPSWGNFLQSATLGGPRPRPGDGWKSLEGKKKSASAEKSLQKDLSVSEKKSKLLEKVREEEKVGHPFSGLQNEVRKNE